jgi:hypothetical protein
VRRYFLGYLEDRLAEFVALDGQLRGLANARQASRLRFTQPWLGLGFSLPWFPPAAARLLGT